MTQVLEISKVQLQGDSEKEFDLNQIHKLLIDPTKEIPPPPTAWVQTKENVESIMGTLGNFSVLIGKAKSRKSFLVSLIISILFKIIGPFRGTLPENKLVVLYIDTEQGEYHCQKAYKRILQLCGTKSIPNLKMYFLRPHSPGERLKIIEHLIKTTENLGFVVIDGIRDVVVSINSEEDAIMASTKLLKWTEEYGIHILTVLHQNKGNDNARGHLGTELMNKAETVLSVTKSEEDESVSIVSPEYCRNIEPDSFAFEIIDGLPVLVEDFEIRTSTKKQSFEIESIEKYKLFQILTEVFSKQDEYSYNDLKYNIKKAFKNQFSKKLTEHKCRDLINEFKYNGWITQEADRKPYKIGKYEPDI